MTLSSRDFVHLHCHSAFSFLDGAMDVEMLASRAQMLGMEAVALTDNNTIAGLPAFHRWAAVHGIRPISGAELTLDDESHLTVLVETEQGYANLCRILTMAYDIDPHRWHIAATSDAAQVNAFAAQPRASWPTTSISAATYTASSSIAASSRSEATYLGQATYQSEPAHRSKAAQRREADARRRNPQVPEAALLTYGEGLLILSGCRRGRIPQLLLRRQDAEAERVARLYATAFPGRFYIELQADGYPKSDELNRRLADLAEHIGVPRVATGNVHHVAPETFPVYDVLTCIRLGCDIRTPHAQRPLNSARWLFPADEALRRFHRYPDAILNTRRIAERCQFTLALNQSLFPEYRLPHGEREAGEYLEHLVYEGAMARYPKVDRALRQRLDHELAIIRQLGYADYFLVVWDIVNFARSRRIRCAGRGSAADSAVAYCLYITDVDAAGRGLLFERFMSLERAEKPDIDIDFDSRRRDEVMAYVYQTYGSNHVARVATYQTFRGRSAIREVGGVLGIPESLLDTIAKRVPWMAHADRLEALFDRVPELQDLAEYRQQLAWLWKLAAAIAGFPRHFGMHVGGLIISRRPLLTLTSLQPSAKGEWMTPFDKDAVEDVGLVKLDLLSLRTMSAIEDAVRLRERAGHALDYDSIPFDDAQTFEMLGTGDTIGVFQLESPAQRALQARLHPEGLEDIVASVALIRPGPIKGNMVDPFLERRLGQAPVSYLHPKLEPILGKTYGVVLFQEQVIEIATAIANFTPGEADQLRRVMSHARSAQEMETIGRHFLEKASHAGVDPDVAATIFSYIQGYASYGFCEAHAAAFAATAYKTAYLVQHHPAEFYAAILNQYPMGYYPVHVICAEARRRGLQVAGVDVNRSEWSCTVEDSTTIRLGFCRLKGMKEAAAQALCEERASNGPFHSGLELLMRVPAIDRLTAERLIRCGGLDSVHPHARRRMLWGLPAWIEGRSVSGSPGPLMDLVENTGTPWLGSRTFGSNTKLSSEKATEPDLEADLTLATKLADEYHTMGVGITGHWMHLFRPWLQQAGVLTAAEANAAADDSILLTAGLLVRPHRPPTKSGKTVVFFTLEDETGFMDATMFESIYHESGAVLFTPYGRLVGVTGQVQRRGGGRAQLIVQRVWPLAK